MQIVCMIKCNEFSEVTLATHLSHPFTTAWILYYLCKMGEGATEHTTRNQVKIVCMIKCNEFSEVTLATHLSHLFTTAWILFYLCFYLCLKFIISKGISSNFLAFHYFSSNDPLSPISMLKILMKGEQL